MIFINLSELILKNFNLDDIVVWADGSYCTFEEYRNGECAWKSDDVEVLPYDSERCIEFLTDNEPFVEVSFD